MCRHSIQPPRNNSSFLSCELSITNRRELGASFLYLEAECFHVFEISYQASTKLPLVCACFFTNSNGYSVFLLSCHNSLLEIVNTSITFPLLISYLYHQKSNWIWSMQQLWTCMITEIHSFLIHKRKTIGYNIDKNKFTIFKFT